ncbi:MAG: histidine phosphatase family protein [Thioalkalivibrio sp.]
MSSADLSAGLTLILVRHSQAEDATLGVPDCERALTDQGIKRMNQAARGLRKLLGGVDAIITSPCTRAHGTARILSRALDRAPVEVLALLSPGATPEDLVQWLATQPTEGVRMLVGHEPDLSRLASWLCAGRKTPQIEMKKGAACALRFDGPVSKARGMILWLMNQAQLRKL